MCKESYFRFFKLLSVSDFVYFCKKRVLFGNSKVFGYAYNVDSRGGFTLIELLIVIGIIAILAGAVVIAVSPGERLASARDATRERHVQAIEQAVLSYQVDNEGNFPETLENSLGGEICNTNLESPDSTDLIDISPIVNEGYLSSIPISPQKEGDGTGYGILRQDSEFIVWAMEGETRKVGRSPAVEFDGGGSVGDYIEVANNDFLNSQMEEVSVAIWIKPKYEDNFVAVLDATDGDWAGDGYSLYLRPHQSPGSHFAWNINGTYERTGTIKKNEWQYLVATSDGSEMNVYVDGEEVGSRSSPSTISPTNDPMWIGRMDGRNWQYLQKIKDVRIYNRGLSEKEIKGLYSGEHISDGLVGHWLMNEGQGSTAYDHSGNESHGTLEGDPQWVIGR